MGTEVNEKWWRRYTRDRLFMRGNGEYWYDRAGFYFLRYLTKEPIFIPFQKIVEIKSGKWHAGRWAWGNPIMKIVWKKGNLTLSSGFIVTRKKEEAHNIIELLKSRASPQIS